MKTPKALLSIVAVLLYATGPAHSADDPVIPPSTIRSLENSVARPMAEAEKAQALQQLDLVLRRLQPGNDMNSQLSYIRLLERKLSDLQMQGFGDLIDDRNDPDAARVYQRMKERQQAEIEDTVEELRRVRGRK